MTSTLDSISVPAPSRPELRGRSIRVSLGWVTVLAAVAVAAVLAVSVFAGGSDTVTGSRTTFTEHGRIHAVESSIRPDTPFTEHGRIQGAGSAGGAAAE